MKIYNTDDFSEKLKIKPVDVKDLNVDLGDSAIYYLNDHLKERFAYMYNFNNNHIESNQTVSNFQKYIDRSEKSINVLNQSGYWSIDIQNLKYFYDKFEHTLKFNQYDCVQLLNNGKPTSSPSISHFYEAFSDKNKIETLCFYDTVFTDDSICKLVSICHIEVIQFLKCSFSSDYRKYMNRAIILSNSIYNDITFVGYDTDTKLVLRSLGWQYN